MMNQDENTKRGSTSTGLSFLPLIAPKKLKSFSPHEYMEYVKSMFARRVTSRTTKKTSPAPGISLSKTKKGAWSIRRAKSRAFAYILEDELKALVGATEGLNYAEAWSLFKSKEWIITKSRMEAEEAYAKLKNLTW